MSLPCQKMCQNNIKILPIYIVSHENKATITLSCPQQTKDVWVLNISVQVKHNTTEMPTWQTYAYLKASISFIASSLAVCGVLMTLAATIQPLHMALWTIPYVPLPITSTKRSSVGSS